MGGKQGVGAKGYIEWPGWGARGGPGARAQSWSMACGCSSSSLAAPSFTSSSSSNSCAPERGEHTESELQRNRRGRTPASMVAVQPQNDVPGAAPAAAAPAPCARRSPRNRSFCGMCAPSTAATPMNKRRQPPAAHLVAAHVRVAHEEEGEGLAAHPLGRHKVKPHLGLALRRTGPTTKEDELFFPFLFPRGTARPTRFQRGRAAPALVPPPTAAAPRLPDQPRNRSPP